MRIFENLNLGTKLLGGFAIVLVLLLVVALFGYEGLSGVSGGARTADDFNSMANEILKVRRHEMRFMLRGEEQEGREVLKRIHGLQQRVSGKNGNVSTKSVGDHMQQAARALQDYEAAFKGYRDIEDRKKTILEKMQDKALDALTEAETFREAQNLQLEAANAKAEKIVNDTFSNVDHANRIIKRALRSRQDEKDYIITGAPKDAERVRSHITAMIAQARDLTKSLALDGDRKYAAQIINEAEKYQKTFDQYLAQESRSALTRMRIHARNVESAAESIQQSLQKQLEEAQARSKTLMETSLRNATDANTIMRLLLETRQLEKEIAAVRNSKAADAARANMERAVALGSELKERAGTSENIEQVDSAVTAMAAYKKAFAEFTAALKEQHKAETRMISAAHETQKIFEQARFDQRAQMDALTKTATRKMLIVSALAVLTGCMLSFTIGHRITKPLKKVILGLVAGSGKMSSAASQVSSASQSLAEGSSRQAASIEETSSSLEEMSSTTKLNAQNAQQADNLMREASQVVQEAHGSMAELTSSMEEISRASEETSNIIKTIDEIAFQTNLLALNAAVEAARAGGAGAGFAVVADEVRNLAIRSAEAARSTADLIEETVKRVKFGSDQVSRTNTSFDKVSAGTRKVGELVAEIAAASAEQSEGIEQLNRAAVEMGAVTQSIAANAEESAGAAQETNAQIGRLSSFIGDLENLIGRAGAAEDQRRWTLTRLLKKAQLHKQICRPEASEKEL